MKLTLVDNWRCLWRAFSVQAMALSLAVQTTWTTMPEDLKAVLPPDTGTYLACTLLVFGIIGRCVQQDKVSGD